MQFLFSHEINANSDLDAALESCWDVRTIRKGAREFAEELIRGLTNRRDEVESALGAALDHYEVNRLNSIDRNLLRLAIYELLYVGDTPDAVVLNEAIEIAKRFGGPESASFVNGVLDRIRRDQCAGEGPSLEKQPLP